MFLPNIPQRIDEFYSLSKTMNFRFPIIFVYDSNTGAFLLSTQWKGSKLLAEAQLSILTVSQFPLPPIDFTLGVNVEVDFACFFASLKIPNRRTQETDSHLSTSSRREKYVLVLSQLTKLRYFCSVRMSLSKR